MGNIFAIIYEFSPWQRQMRLSSSPADREINLLSGVFQGGRKLSRNYFSCLSPDESAPLAFKIFENFLKTGMTSGFVLGGS